MAKAHLGEKETMILQDQSYCFNKDSASPRSINAAAFRFNADAPEFVPRPPAPVPISGYFVPCFPFIGGANGGDWIFLGDQDALSLVSNSNPTSPPHQPKTVLTEELQRKILKQVFVL